LTSGTVIASASEAIHRAAKQKAGLLPPSLVELRRTRSSQTLACANASRLSQAMTPEQDMHPHSRRARCARALRQLPPSLRKRAQGKPGARCTRGLVCKLHKKMRTRAYRSSGGIPAFPARWFYGFFRALPGERLCCHRRRRDTPASLTPASRRQDHTTSPSASACARQSQLSRPPHPTRAFVTCATPLSSGETRKLKSVICPTATAEYFCNGVWTGCG